MDGRQTSKDHQTDQTLATLPPELHPCIVGHLYRHEAAMYGEVCRFFYQVTRHPQSHYRKLPFAPRNYAEKRESIFFSFENHNEVGDMIILSDNKIAFIFRWGIKLKIIDLVGYNLAETVFEDKIIFESAPELPATSIFPFIAEVSGKLIVGSNHSDVFKVFDLALSGKPQFIKTVNTTFTNTWTRDDFDHLIPLQEDRFVAVRPQVLKVFDLAMPAGQECVKTMTSATAWRISALSNNHLIRYSGEVDNKILDILDISQTEGKELVRSITLDDPICFTSILSSGRIAVCCASDPQNINDATLIILDLRKPKGQEAIYQLPIFFQSRVMNLIALPDEKVGFLLVNKEISIYDCSPASVPICVAKHSAITNDAYDQIAVLKDGRILGYSEAGDIWLNNFPTETFSNTPSISQKLSD